MVLSGPTTVWGATGLPRGASLAKQHLDSGEAGTMKTLEVGAASKISNQRKMKRKGKTKAKL
jgi:hypothetical protein